MYEEDLVFVEVDPVKVFQTEGVIFTDGNAAANMTKCYTQVQELLNRPGIAGGSIS
jgi:hypothetical protein